jgi:DNA primase
MSGFPPEFLEEVKAKNDIVDVVSKYVTLNRRGNNYWACCPFHNEKTPSFSVKQDGQFFKCFGCGES